MTPEEIKRLVCGDEVEFKNDYFQTAWYNGRIVGITDEVEIDHGQVTKTFRSIEVKPDDPLEYLAYKFTGPQLITQVRVSTVSAKALKDLLEVARKDRDAFKALADTRLVEKKQLEADLAKAKDWSADMERARDTLAKERDSYEVQLEQWKKNYLDIDNRLCSAAKERDMCRSLAEHRLGLLAQRGDEINTLANQVRGLQATVLEQRTLIGELKKEIDQEHCDLAVERDRHIGFMNGIKKALGQTDRGMADPTKEEIELLHSVKRLQEERARLKQYNDEFPIECDKLKMRLVSLASGLATALNLVGVFDDSQLVRSVTEKVAENTRLRAEAGDWAQRHKALEESLKGSFCIEGWTTVGKTGYFTGPQKPHTVTVSLAPTSILRRMQDRIALSLEITNDAKLEAFATKFAPKVEIAQHAPVFVPEDNIDGMIGRLDRILSEFLLAADVPADEADRQTLKHHADDLIGVGNAALKRLAPKPPHEHTNGPGGFAPCTRSWPHDGPCAHPPVVIPRMTYELVEIAVKNVVAKIRAEAKHDEWDAVALTILKSTVERELGIFDGSVKAHAVSGGVRVIALGTTVEVS